RRSCNWIRSRNLRPGLRHFGNSRHPHSGALECTTLVHTHHDLLGAGHDRDGLRPHTASVLHDAFLAWIGRGGSFSPPPPLFFPGIVVYLTHWFIYEDRAKAVAAFMAAIPLAYAIGSPISGLLLGVHWGGLRGWQWLFIVEGLPALFFGVMTWFYLTDWPQQA